MRQRLRIIPAFGHQRPQLGIAEIGEVDFVELQVTAAGVGEGAHDFAVTFAKVAIELVHARINRRRHGIAPVAEMERGRRRNRHFSRRLGARGDEFEMLDHGMGAIAVEPSGHAQHHRLGLRTLELDLALAQIGFDAVELAEKVIVPKRAAEFAIGNRP